MSSSRSRFAARSSNAAHRWRFFRAGGVDQVSLETGEDLLALDELDPKLWVALACPVSSIEFDQRSARSLDADGDGRIRVSDVVDAVKWLRPRIKNPADLIGGRTELPLTSIDDATPEGQQLLDGARNALRILGRGEAANVSVDDVAAALVAFHKMPLNGDGVVTTASTEDAELKAAISDLVSATGGVPDRSGAQGVDEATLDAFYADAQAWRSWRDEGARGSTRPLGDGTAQAWELLTAVAPKIDDYFARTRWAAFDGRAWRRSRPAPSISTSAAASCASRSSPATRTRRWPRSLAPTSRTATARARARARR